MNRFNSTIKQKTCKCGCGLMPTLGWSGFKMSHAPQELKDKQTKKQVEKKNRAKLSDLSRKLHLAANDKGNELKGNLEAVMSSQKQLSVWFADICRLIAQNPYCMECGTFIPNKIKLIGTKQVIDGYRCATAHIFPKAVFESISTHPMNFLILGAGCGCHEKSHRLDTFSDMKCFSEAVRRFKLFEKSITEKHKYLNAFRDYANGNQ